MFEDNNIAAATEKYAGRYFLEKDSEGYRPTILKIKRFEKDNDDFGPFVRGDYFWYCTGGRTVHVEMDKRLYLAGAEEFSIESLLESLGKKYSEISKEEFQKYKDLAIKNIIGDL